MYIGVEIGGTKLQAAAGEGASADLVQLCKFDVDRAAGAHGILDQLKQAIGDLVVKHSATGIGVGFGGPVDVGGEVVLKSHHVQGWDDFPLHDWCVEQFNLPTTIANDCDTAGLAEARFGAGQGRRSVFYVTVGTGIGGGFILDGRIHRGAGGGAAEIGHLRPGVAAEDEDQIVETVSSGWGIAATAQAILRDSDAGPVSVERPRIAGTTFTRLDQADRDDLASRCDGNWEKLTTKIIGQAAQQGNAFARSTLASATQTLGWAVAQTITLLAPDVVIVGGGVSLLGEELFFEPLRMAVHDYVFPPLRAQYEIVPAALGEQVVVHGALALARDYDAL